MLYGAADSSSSTSTSNAGTPQSRARDLEAAEHRMQEMEKGKKNFEGIYKVRHAKMWWC
jgi:hypothetical protein